MTRAPVAAALLLAACGSAAEPDRPPDARIACRVDGAARFERVCSVERAAGPNGPVLVLRKPGGGFRRVVATGDDRRYIAADGAEPARVVPLGHGRTLVAIGGDEFQL